MRKIKTFLAMALAIAITFTNCVVVFAVEPTPEQDIAAQWVANTVKVTFNSNGGGVAPGVQVYTYGVERSLPGTCAMKKIGYTFIGWSTSSGATTPDWEPGATSSTAFDYADETKAIAKTLYAVWKEDASTTTTTARGGNSKVGVFEGYEIVTVGSSSATPHPTNSKLWIYTASYSGEGSFLRCYGYSIGTINYSVTINNISKGYLRSYLIDIAYDTKENVPFYIFEVPFNQKIELSITSDQDCAMYYLVLK